MKHTIPRADWHMKLADAIEKASAGDTIVCHSEAMKHLGESARKWLCPDKDLVFVLEGGLLTA